MRKAIVFLKNTSSIPAYDGDYIGCDKGALVLAKQGVHMSLAIGDFDSIDPDDAEELVPYCEKLVRLNPVKDESDSQAAVDYLLAEGYTRIVLWQALGQRADHAFVNLCLTYEHPGTVVLADEYNVIEAAPPGRHILHDERYRYRSFFTFDEAVISLIGVKYPLDHRRINRNSLYTLSNEIVSDEALLIVHEGTVLVMKTRDH